MLEDIIVVAHTLQYCKRLTFGGGGRCRRCLRLVSPAPKVEEAARLLRWRGVRRRPPIRHSAGCGLGRRRGDSGRRGDGEVWVRFQVGADLQECRKTE